MNRQMTTDQVAEVLQLPAKAVRKFINCGDLTATNVGTLRRPTYRVDESAVKEFLKNRAVTT
jgi:excisionase family DNA binding protein